MAMNLLERDRELAALAAQLEETTTGQGRIALISGEAGIGKTALVERFIARCPAGTRTLWAACEALYTPRPLGPLYDIAQQAPGPLRGLLETDASRATLFAALLDDLIQAPAILVVEDIHWADEATLDLLKYLARRIQQTATLLILTHRDDEPDKDHPLRQLVGDLPARDVTRLRLLPLSEAAVAALAQSVHRPAGRLYAITGGNPFFLTETLAYDAPGAPMSVADAVLARVTRRSPAARRLLDLVAVAPNRIERWAIEAAGAGNVEALDECLAAQMLRLDGQTVAFRHELARQAVEGALSPARRQALHAMILRALVERGVEQATLARLAHHATQAEDHELMLRYVPAAARQASTQGAHREAAAHYQTALRYADQMAKAQQAAVLDALASEYYLTGQVEEALAPTESALALWRGLGETEQAGRTLRRLSRLSWLLGDNAEAQRHGLAAVEALESLPPSRELAMAYGNLAQLGTRSSDGAGAIWWGERAIALAERLGDYETLSYALNSVGAGEIESGDKRGRAKLESSLAIALEHGYEEHAARAYANLAIHSTLRHQYPEAERYLRDGIAYCAERDLDPWGHFLRWVQARARLDQGDWSGAEEDAAAILSVPWMAVTNRIPALLVLGRVWARRGQSGVEALLGEARDLALSVGEIQRVEQVVAARAEWRWLQGDLAGCAAEASVAFRQPFRVVRPWYQAEVVIWLWRSGALNEAPEGTPAPHALEIAGDWRAAAETWERMGCPYEQALALLRGEVEALRTALAIFEQLGAAPAAEITRRRLRERGARGLHRGPRPVTRANPQGLTNRELEVLPLLAGGLRNAEIAGRLSTSPRTVEHHVSGILMKLNARSRAEAVQRAYELGLLSRSPSASGAKIGG
jgi:DNA-binding CsgD family transcriptional regulator